MKKYVTFIISILVLFPVFSFSQTTGASALLGKVSSCSVASVDLSFLSRDAQTNGAVSVLQTFLNKSGFLQASPTGYFGSMTKAAVVAFQKANDISPVSGFVGPKTRAKMQTLGCGTNTAKDPGTTKKLSISCKPNAAVLSDVSGGDVVFIGVGLSLTDPCPTPDGIIHAKTTIHNIVDGYKTVAIDFLPTGNIALLGNGSYTVPFVNAPIIQTADLKIIGPGTGELVATACADGKDGYCGAGYLYFLLADDGEFLVGNTSPKQLISQKLKNNIISEFKKFQITSSDKPADSFDMTLPPTFVSTSEWAPTNNACAGGGYDLSLYSGKNVSVASYTSSEMFNKEPLDVKVISNGYKIVCVFRSVKKGSTVAPGVFPVIMKTSI